MKRAVQIVVLVLVGLLVFSCGGGQQPTVEQRLADHETRIASLEDQVKALTPQAVEEPTETTNCANKPAHLIEVDLGTYATVKVPYFVTDLDYVVRMYPVSVVQKEDGATYINESPDQALKHPVWFVVSGPTKSVWLTGSIDSDKDAAPAAMVFPVFVNAPKLSLDLQFGADHSVYKVVSSTDLSSAVSWIKACGIVADDIAFFGGQYLKPPEFTAIFKQVPSLRPNK